MKFIKNLLLLLVFIKCSLQQIQDPSFQRYCQRFNQPLTRYEIRSEGEAIPNPVGDRCTVSMDFPARDDKEAEIYCERWGMFVLVEAKADGNRVSCTYENVYECKDNFDQIRGMCYKKFHTLQNYTEAEEECKKSHAGAEILKLHSKHQSELLEAFFGDTLKMYFLQPDKTLEQSSQFVADESNDPNSNYVITYTYSIHYDVGPNTILKLNENVKAFAMCMYQPPETILSFAVKAKKLAKYYYPTQLVGAMGVWRTSSHYTPTEVAKSQLDVCEKSMKAILGTSDGTLLNLKPANTKLFSDDVKKSFNRAFGPFVYCSYTDSRGFEIRHIYFSNKQTKNKKCSEQANLKDSDYNANFMRDLDRYKYSFVFYPEKTENSLSFEASLFSLHSPLLCGLHYEKDVHRPYEICPDGWSPWRRSTGTICHKYFSLDQYGDKKHKYFDEARQFCYDQEADMSRWDNYGEYEFVQSLRDVKKCGGSCDAWVKCYDKHGCNDVETMIEDGEINWPDLRLSWLTWYDVNEQSVMCEKASNR